MTTANKTAALPPICAAAAPVCIVDDELAEPGLAASALIAAAVAGEVGAEVVALPETEA